MLLMLCILLCMADSENATATENTWDAADRSMPTKRTNHDLWLGIVEFTQPILVTSDD